MNKWVSVKDGLPEGCTNVLVYLKRNSRLQHSKYFIYIDFYIYEADERKGEWNDYHSPGEYNYHVTHWMPLPGPPEEEK